MRILSHTLEAILIMALLTALALCAPSASAEDPPSPPISYEDACIADCAEEYFKGIANCEKTLFTPSKEVEDPLMMDSTELEICMLLQSMAYFRCETLCKALVGT